MLQFDWQIHYCGSIIVWRSRPFYAPDLKIKGSGMPSIQNLCNRKLLDYIINYVKSRKLHECDGKLFKNLAMG